MAGPAAASPRAAVSAFDPTSLTWRIHNERITLVSLGRALLMQAADTRALGGFIEHSRYGEDPWGRLWRTGKAMRAALFGTAAEAEAVGRRVRAMHARVRGTTSKAIGPVPAGSSYAADDPELLLWVHATLVDTRVRNYRRWVGDLTSVDAERYHQEMKAVAELFGLPRKHVPETFAELREYMRTMMAGEFITVTPEARDIARTTVLGPPLPPGLQQLWVFMNFLTVGSLPSGLRRDYGFTWTPAHQLAYDGSTTTARHLLPLVPSLIRHFESAAAQ